MGVVEHSIIIFSKNQSHDNKWLEDNTKINNKPDKSIPEQNYICMIPRTNTKIIREIIELYNSGYGTMYIARSLSISRCTIQKYLMLNGIRLRKTSPRFHYNIKFFSKYDPISAYWAGFIAADGYIRKNRATLHIKLKKSDYPHLLKFCIAIGYNAIPKIAKNGEYCYIDISGKWFIDDLKVKYKIAPNKTKNVNISENIPIKYLPHFIRGYFDGDGCISWSTTSYISFVSASVRMLNQISCLFKNLLRIKLKSKNDTPPIMNHSSISYSGKNAGIILKWMYKDSDDAIRLNRKHERYLKYY